MSIESFPKSDEIIMTEEEIESRVDSILDKLPKEISDRFEEGHRNMKPENKLNVLEDLIKRRRELLSKEFGLDNDPEHVSVLETKPQAVLNLLEKVERSEHVELGAGNAGRVIASVRHPNICYKVMFPKSESPEGTNNIAKETDLQEEIASFGEQYGVRAPRVFFFVHEGNVRAISMERLNAVSLRDVLTGKEKLPESFKEKEFFDSLRKYVGYINEKGYYHRDLHDGNIMIDLETGNPYVIDFGMSKHSNFPDDVYREQIVGNGHMVENVLQSDLEGLSFSEIQFQKYKKRRGV